MVNTGSIFVSTPMGALKLCASDRGLISIEFSNGDKNNTDRANKTFSRKINFHLDMAEQQLGEYFSGSRKSFELVIAPEGTVFQKRAWRALGSIPYGKTVSYKDQAVMLGGSNYSRAVGGANNKNPLPIVVPCHRVVGSKGSLVGYAGGLEVKQWLLDWERSNP